MFSNKKLIISINFLICFAIHFFIENDAATANSGSICVSQESCGKCLSADWSCSWCTDRLYDMRKSRCMTRMELLQSNCRTEYIYENIEYPIEYLSDHPPYDYKEDSFDAIQIQPQWSKLKLKKKQTKTIKMIYRPARNYPLDLYYLMDLTWSMKDDKETLVNVGNDLINTLFNLTENYRMGFGSFADKPSMPFILPGEKLEANPCAPDHFVCEPTYGYRHRLSLTRNITEFINKVNDSDVTANLDNLEGGLDALMQVLVCDDRIGWDKHSRKIVLFATDGQMHFAGDGLLAGVVQKNDKLCHLTDDGNYSGTLQLDYPSLEEIYRELLKRKVNVIFAVTQDVLPVYDQIHSLMQEISSVGTLKMDSSNILDLVKVGYREFVKKVQFFDDTPQNLAITYETKCGDQFHSVRKQSRCDNIEIGKEYEFFINITLLEYPDKNVTSQRIKIEESSLSSEFLLIDIEFEDECPCLLDEIGDRNSVACNRNGEMKCGMCFCNPGWAGTSCECDLLNYESSKQLDNLCRLKTTDLREGVDALKLDTICSDRGECNCGKCHCNLGYSGKYCECTACPYYQDEICGGSERATCECGQCVCKSGWSGKRCDCMTSQTMCTSPNDTRICSGHGQCDCGHCKCQPNYHGSYCESNISSNNNSLCQYYESCVKCHIQRKDNQECNDLQTVCRRGSPPSGDENAAIADGDNDVNAIPNTEFIPEYYNDLEQFPIKCLVRVTNAAGDQCDHYFSYVIDSDLINHLKIQYTNCDRPQTAFISGLIVLCTFLLGAFIVLIYKICTTIKDNREYAKFETEQNNTLYNQQSPIYKSPVTKYTVPESLRKHEMEMYSL